MADSVFTKIIKGEIPAEKVYEDNSTFVFMDIYPIQPGQVLVVPKKQIGFVWDMEAEDYHALMDTVQKVGRRMREVFSNKSRVGVMIEGLDVDDHVHVKVFPFSTADEFRTEPNRTREPDYKAIKEMAKKLAF